MNTICTYIHICIYGCTYVYMYVYIYMFTDTLIYT